ncbi:MAG: rod shape-determining protein [Clostridia bacterium]|nr:rod shape-determining protein [Clostridia bacterium]
MPGMDLGLDLGTSRIVIATPRRGILLKEPTVMAVETATDRPIAYGEEAAQMLGRTPDSISAVKPLERGVIADYGHAEQLLKYFLRQVCRYKIIKPRVTVSIPSEMTEVEQRSVLEAVYMAGARHVSLIEKAVAAAIGAGADVTAARGCMSVHVGAGSTEVATMALGGVVNSLSQRTGSLQLDEAIQRHMREVHHLIIGERMAEQAKLAIGGVIPRPGDPVFPMRGRDMLTGLPRLQEVSSSELCGAIKEPLSEMLDTVRRAMEATPPELLADVLGNEVILSGGGAQLYGFADWVCEQTRTPCRLVESPEETVALGAADSVATLSRLAVGSYDVSRFSYHLSDNVV